MPGASCRTCTSPKRCAAASSTPDDTTDTDLTDAEIRHAVDRETAMTVADVLVRRTGSFFWSADGDAAAINHVSDALAERHHFPGTVRATQRADYEHWVARNRGRRDSS